MEQLKDPKSLIRQSGRVPVTFETRYQNKEHPGSREAWQRLSEVDLDPLVLKHNRLLSDTAGDHSIEIDLLRTRLLNHIDKCGGKRIGVTSPTEGCGKSTVLANLALSLGRRSDLRVLVYDFDFRNPELIELFGLSQVGPRFSVLSGTRRNFESTCLRVAPGLALSLNHTRPTAPAELLASAKTRHLLSQIEAEYQPDVVLFDLPALLPWDDTRGALDMIDFMLLVGQADRTTLPELEKSTAVLDEHETSAGIVLNRARFN